MASIDSCFCHLSKGLQNTQEAKPLMVKLFKFMTFGFSMFQIQLTSRVLVQVGSFSLSDRMMTSPYRL